MRRALPFLLCLAACDTPDPLSAFANTTPTRITVDGSTFSVRVAGTQATATRLDFDMRARTATILPRAGVAMERVSGCTIREGSLKGDAAMATARLGC
jgi:hypothetical protein